MPGLKNFKDDLREAGKRHPKLLIQKLETVGLSDLEFSIMKLRYVDGLLMKQIAFELSVGERWAKRVHYKATMKALDVLKPADLFELGIHLKTTLRPLYTV